ncbi:MAG: alpha/beta hydrolase [Pseudomonadota bacterium]|nr:alpha/beta hydrolase [Pseudomonadota bacterium]
MFAASAVPDPSALPTPIEVRRIAVGDVTLEVRFAGPVDGPPVLCLHGFPQCWWAWRQQVEPLVAAGYRLILPNQRGYGASDKPAGIASYRLDVLVADLVGLLDALGIDRVRVVAHDWGGLVAWWFAHTQPARVERQVILSAPHPTPFLHAMRRPPQVFKSWYIYYFQLPWLPDWAVGNRTLRTLEYVVQTGLVKYPEADLDVFRAHWAQPGTVTAMLNWYRAFLQQDNAPPPPGPIQPRTLVLWGVADAALGTELAHASAALCADATVEIIPGAGHWIPHEAPDFVNDRLLTFLGAP